MDKCEYPNCAYFAFFKPKHCCLAQECELAKTLRLGYPEADPQKLKAIQEKREVKNG